MRRIEVALLALLLVAVAALVAVRTTGGADVRDAEPAHRPGTVLLRFGTWWTGGDRPREARTPERFIRLRKPAAIVVGSVEGVDRGRDLLGPTPNPGQHSRWQPFLVVRVRVSATLLGEDSGLIHDGRVDVEVPQAVWIPRDYGGHYLFAPLPLSTWRRETPAGTRVLLFLRRDRYDARPGVHGVRHGLRGMPPDAPLAVVVPRGVVQEYRGRVMPYDRHRARWWHVRSLDGFGDRVERYLEGRCPLIMKHRPCRNPGDPS